MEAVCQTAAVEEIPGIYGVLKDAHIALIACLENHLAATSSETSSESK